MHISPDDIGAAITGGVIVLGGITVGIGKAVQLLRELRKEVSEVGVQAGEITRQTGPNGENAARIAAQQAADATTRIEHTIEGLGAVVDQIAAEQTRQGGTIHSLDTGLGGVRDDLRIIRREAGQTRDDVAEVRTQVADLDRKHDELERSAEARHDQLEAGQQHLAAQVEQLTRPAPDGCGGWDHGDHVTAHHDSSDHQED
jgi:chromosome segregation ATPase